MCDTHLCQYPFIADVDECVSSLHACDVDSYCSNTVGSYICKTHREFDTLNANKILRRSKHFKEDSEDPVSCFYWTS